MDPIFNRLGNLIRSMFQEETDRTYKRRSGPDSFDPDLHEAWEELDDFLKQDSGTPRRTRTTQPPRMPPLELKKDYELLEVPFGAPFSEVKKGYKKMIARYHPDKHADTHENLKQATSLTQKLNDAYRRIKKYEDTKKF